MTINIPAKTVSNVLVYHHEQEGVKGYLLRTGSQTVFIEEHEADRLARYMLFNQPDQQEPTVPEESPEPEWPPLPSDSVLVDAWPKHTTDPSPKNAISAGLYSNGEVVTYQNEDGELFQGMTFYPWLTIAGGHSPNRQSPIRRHTPSE